MEFSEHDKVLVVFYSYPIEASLTGIFRGYEVCSPKKIVVVSTRRRADDLDRLVEILKSVFSDVEIVSMPILPDIETSIEEIPSFIDYVKKVIDAVKGYDICFVISSGSRIEVVSFSMVVDRSLLHALYISFLWGPWRSSFYPYTPKPIQPVHEVHSYGLKPTAQTIYVDDDTHSKLLRDVSILRRETLLTQYRFNLENSATPCYIGRDYSECSCRSMKIEVFYGRSPRIIVEIDDYCSPDSILKALYKLAREAYEVSLPDPVKKALNLLLNVSGVRLLAIEECSYGCQEDRDVALVDYIEKTRRRIVVDTNVLYMGIHNQFYENEHIFRQYMAIPLCLYVEMYEHQAHPQDPYRRLRASLVKLLLEELNRLNPAIDTHAAYTPCEVGIALSKQREVVVVTADRHAYTNLFKTLNVESILLKPVPISKTRFLHDENSRRISYAYYALSQLKALTKILRDELHSLGLSIEIAMV